MNPVSVVEVATKTRAFTFLLHIFFVRLLLLACLFIATGHASDESEIHCLRSIKQSIDPFNHLSDWDFHKNPEGSNFCVFSGAECIDMDEQIRVVSRLSLSNMGLKGPIPHSIENCSSLQILDLSLNEISGEIPQSVANLHSLVNLKLDGNKLSGEIPHEIGFLPQIESFDVANNFLSGEVPVFTRSPHLVSLSYANNSGLCGCSLEPCGDNGSTTDRSFWYSFAIAYVCSATSVVVSFMYHFQPWRVLKRRRRNNAATSSFRRNRHNITQTRTTQVAELLPLALQEQGIKELSALLERLIPRINFRELCEATNYFSADNVLGFGRTGIVYKAKLPNNYSIAVKRLYDSPLYKTEFLLETIIPGKHRHHNVFPLVGFCLDKKERVLVYKYMSNGKLQNWLQQSDNINEPPQAMLLEWPVRVYIALGLARGLSWLHDNCKIVHLSLSSECVLLSKDFEPKISNFGKAKFINQTINYDLRMKLDMINGFGEKGSVEKDVYSFGIILFELITGKGLNPITNGSSDSTISVKLLIGARCDFYNVIDKFLIGKGFDDKILGLIEVACDCVKSSVAQRPKMANVYKRIRALWEGYGPTYDHSATLIKRSMVCPVEVT